MIIIKNHLMQAKQNHTLDFYSMPMYRTLYLVIIFLLLAIVGCNQETEQVSKGTYGYDVEFIRNHTRKVIELNDESGQAKVLLSADYQGRVMTSTAAGRQGTSYGWLNYDLIASGEKKKQFNPVGGEERFWLGPEGGQYSLYFHQGDSFRINHWQVPPLIDTAEFDIVESSSASATFTKRASLINYSGTKFDLSIERTISLLNKSDLESELGVTVPEGVKYVSYQSANEIKNIGADDWTKENGLLSIWLLGMFTPSEQTTVIIPFKGTTDANSLITTNYFGEIPKERLSIKDSVLYFTCDGKYRSKIGVSPVIAKPISASYDFRKNILTIVRFEVLPAAAYVNSKWEIQEEPYQGDAVNSYNDGPLADGSQLGPFYELESSSPALALPAGEVAGYNQITCHFEGDFEKLNVLARKILGVDLQEIKK
jgi:hypothetical protein